MINVDTMRVYSSFNHVVKFWDDTHPRAVKHTITKNVAGNEIEEFNYRLDCSDIIGLSNVWYTPESDKLTLEMSSKRLGKNYYKHINKNTILQAIDNVNEALKGVLFIDPLKLVEGSSVGRLDVLEDTKMKNIDRRLLINGLQRNPKERFMLRPDGKLQNSLIIERKAKSDNTRMTLYDKLEQMTTGAEKLTNMTLFDPYKHFVDTNRTELMLRQRKAFRKYLNVDVKGDVPLEPCLLSNEKPLKRYINEFAEANTNPPLFETHQERLERCKNWFDFVHEYGMLSLLRDHNYNIGIIREVARPYFKNKDTLSKAMKKIKERIASEMSMIISEKTVYERFIEQLNG